MNIITIGTLKGGTGKTTVAFNIAGYLAKKKNKVLIIDADPQANISTNLGLEPEFGEDEYDTFSDVLEKQLSAAFAIQKNILDNNACKIDLIPASIDLTSTDSFLCVTSMNKGVGHLQFRKWVEDNRMILEQYDYIICDVGPNISMVTQNCLLASNEIYLVSDISVNGFKGAKLFVEAWGDICDNLMIENKVKGLIINRYDKRTALSEQFVSYIRSEHAFDNLIFDTLLPENVQFKYADNESLPICLYSPTCTGAKAIKTLITEMQSKNLLLKINNNKEGEK